MSKYFVINNSDGDTYVEILDSEILKQRLAGNYYGKVSFIEDIDRADTNYWGGDLLIIKGDIVVPRVIQTVTEYEL